MQQPVLHQSVRLATYPFSQWTKSSNLHILELFLMMKSLQYRPRQAFCHLKTYLQFSFHRLFSNQSLIVNFVKDGYLISGQYFLHQMTISAYFSFQLADSSKKIKKDEIFKSFQLIYFKHFDTLQSSSFRTASIFFMSHFTSFLVC